MATMKTITLRVDAETLERLERRHAHERLRAEARGVELGRSSFLRHLLRAALDAREGGEDYDVVTESEDER